MNELEKFKLNKLENIDSLGKSSALQNLGLEFVEKTALYKYSYNFTWLGIPVIQYPQDMIAMQEIIWETKPDLIIETGIAHGGSLIFSASMLELIGNNGHVLGVDIDIREYNRFEIEKHPMAKRITMIEGSSTDEKIIQKVFEFAKGKQNVMVVLDSNHTHQHVLRELEAYASLVTLGSYLVVFDTIIEDVSENFDWGSRTWTKGNNPKTAVWEFLETNDQFIIDKSFNNKLLISVAPDGYLKRVK
jgi:cephalosporin hydroxylase